MNLQFIEGEPDVHSHAPQCQLALKERANEFVKHFKATCGHPFASDRWRIRMHHGNVVLVLQTFVGCALLPVCVPTRPSQNSPERVAAWERRRQSVGKRIRELRVERSLTQEELAHESGVDRSVLSGVESGRRGLLYERLFDIADALGVPASELMTDPKG